MLDIPQFLPSQDMVYINLATAEKSRMAQDFPITDK